MKKRTDYMQAKYLAYLATNPEPFEKRRIVYDFKDWQVIINEFPHDAWYSTHHLILPTNRTAKFTMLPLESQRRYHIILSQLEDKYDGYKVNFPGARSVPQWWHCHLYIEK